MDGFWQEYGYFVVEDLLGPDDVSASTQEIASIIERAASRDEKAPVNEVEVQYEDGFEAERRSVTERELAVRKLMHLARNPLFEKLAKDRRVLDVVERLIGTEPALLQSMALLKPPAIGSVKDWHQDAPYFSTQPSSRVTGVWIALDEATEQNGCMQVVPGSHRGGVVQHVLGPTGWRLPPELSAEFLRHAKPIALRPGSALFFHSQIFHFTGPNQSAHRRRATQFHYVCAPVQTSPAQ